MRTRAALLAICLSAVPIAGCADGDGRSDGSATTAASPTPATNGLDKKDTDVALKTAQQAFLTAPSVHIKGAVTEAGATTGLDVHLGQKGVSRGTITIDGQTVKLVTDGKYAYFSGDKAFWRDIAGKDAASFEGKYLKSKLTNKDIKDLVTLVDRASLAKNLLPGSSMAFDGRETVAGVRTVRYKDFSGGGYNVALDGEPYPVRLAGKDDGTSVQLDFTDYGKPVDAAPPPARQIIDLDKMRG